MLRLPPFALALALSLLSGCGGSDADGPPPQAVDVMRVTPRPAELTTQFVGTTEAVQEVEIRARVSGLLERVAREGQAVKKGDVLFELDAQPFRNALQQAEAALAQADATAKQTQQDFQRGRRLAPSGALSRQELDSISARRDAAAAAVRAAQAALDTAALNLGYARIESPIDGVVGRALLKEGALVSAFQSLLTTVYSNDPMAVNVSLSETDLVAIERNLGRRLSAEQPPSATLLLGDGAPYPERGQVDFVAPAVDPASGTLAMRLRFPNPEGRLRAGQFVRVVLPTRTVENAILVPRRAIQELQGKRYVWVVDGQGKAQQRDVETGADMGEDVLIARGLEAGTILIVEGAQRLKPGAPVKAQEKDGALAKARAAPAR
jgi:membrane fusion protein, multidrug efflux system